LISSALPRTWSFMKTSYEIRFGYDTVGV